MAAYDLILRNALIFDGAGGEPLEGDIAVKGDRIEQLGAVEEDHAL